MLRTLRRTALPAAGASAVGLWAAVTTQNDEWDAYFTPAPTTPKREKIVILGSGWAGLQALRKCAGPGKDVTVISPRPHFLYTPLLAGSSVGTVALKSACEPLRDLVDRAAAVAASATFLRAEVRDVDVDGRTVLAKTDDAAVDVSYDKLVIAVGAAPATFGIQGVKEHALFMKESNDAAKLHARVVGNLERAAALLAVDAEKFGDAADALLRFVVVGGGPTGVELASELADFRSSDVATRYGDGVASRVKIVLVEAMPRILAPFDASLAAVARDHLVSRGIEVRTGCLVTQLASPTRATFRPSTPRDATAEAKAAAAAAEASEDVGAVVWAAGIAARPVIARLCEKLGQATARGLEVDDRLRVKAAKGDAFGTVFALGDCALSGYAPTAQVAGQQGKYLGRAIRDGAAGADDALMAPFAYAHAGSLCCLGSGHAIAQLAAPRAPAFYAWRGLHAAGKDGDERAVVGGPAFVLWRSLYFSQLLSAKTCFSVSSDWLKTLTSGRDAGAVEPIQRRATDAGLS